MITYRYSSQARAYAHIKIGPDTAPSSHSTASRLCCGMCDSSSRGNWQETTHPDALPIHLTICPSCIEAIGGPAAYAHLLKKVTA